jgi:hypothetical protein
MFVCRMRAPLLLAVLSLCGAAEPDPPRGVIGARKYATNLHDCNGAVAFSSAGALAPTKQDNGKLAYRKALIDKGIGWSPESGDFTCFCPGLYQFAFAGNGKTAATRLAMIYCRPLLLLLLLLLLLSSSLSPLCRVFTHIFRRQTMSLSSTMLQLFCRYCLWCPYH